MFKNNKINFRILNNYIKVSLTIFNHNNSKINLYSLGLCR